MRAQRQENDLMLLAPRSPFHFAVLLLTDLGVSWRPPTAAASASMAARAPGTSPKGSPTHRSGLSAPTTRTRCCSRTRPLTPAAPPPFYNEKCGVSSFLRVARVRATRENVLAATIQTELTATLGFNTLGRVHNLQAQPGAQARGPRGGCHDASWWRTRPLPFRPLLCNGGKQSTLLCDSPLCRGHA